MAFSMWKLMEASFSIESVIRGYHMYKDTWESCIGEELVCKQERHNVHDPFTVEIGFDIAENRKGCMCNNKQVKEAICIKIMC